jgi:hypothetical protein
MTTKSPKGLNFRFKREQVVHEFDLLDYFTICGYKPLLADHKAWIAKISIKEPPLSPSLSLSKPKQNSQPHK